MMYALNAAGERIEADPGGRASCPGCHGDVIAHCGEILVWHWAHRSRLECDPWWEPETAWHRGWKLFVPAAQREVVIGGHRADMVLANGTVCELQASGISPQEIREREFAYDKMIWLMKADEFGEQLLMRDRGTHWTFRWKHPRRSLWAIVSPMFWDLGDGTVFEVKKVHHEVPCGGWGQVHAAGDFTSFLQSVI